MADTQKVLYSKLAFLLAVTASKKLADDIAGKIKGTNIFDATAFKQMMAATGFDGKANQKVFNALFLIRQAFADGDLWPDDECDWCTIEGIFGLPKLDCPPNPKKSTAKATKKVAAKKSTAKAGKKPK